VESPYSFPETTKEYGEKNPVESPGKLVRKDFSGKAYQSFFVEED